MAENEKNQAMAQEEEMILMLDGIYNEIIRNLKKVKEELQSELKYSSMQVEAVKKELSDGLAQQLEAVQNIVYELKLSYQQSQSIHSDLADILNEEVLTKLDSIEGKVQLLESIEKILEELDSKFADLDVDAFAETVSEKVVTSLPPYEEIDYDKIGETVAEKTEASVGEHSRQILEAVAAIPVPENVDYTRIVEEVGDRVLEIVQDTKTEAAHASAVGVEESAPVTVEIDYERIIYETAEKVIESLPVVEKIDYQRIADMVAAQMPKPEIDYDLLAEKLAARLPVAEPVAAAAPMPMAQIDYDALADKVAERVSSTTTVAAAAVVDSEEETNEVFIDEEGVREIAKGVCEYLDLDMLATKIAEKLHVEVKTVAETPVEPVEVVEETPVEETVEEPVVEEAVEEVPVQPAADEVAATDVEEETPNQPVLVEAHGDLVVRLKKSFTAKLKQSDEEVKRNYSALKNAFLQFKKINSNVSWHGDRFNFGRDTVGRINICGKTLGLYLALDPADPEFKTTVYHQKDVSKQKAYESTPFMVKIKSEAGVKKALRLIAALAEKLGTTEDEAFVPVDYVAMFPDATDEQLLSEGLIKSTKEKKVTLDF